MSTSSDEWTRTNTPNFSRPKPPSRATTASALQTSTKKADKRLSDNRERRVHVIDAFHDPARDDSLSEPSFLEDMAASIGSGGGSGGARMSDSSGYNGHAGEIDSQRRKKRFDEQRYSVSSAGSVITAIRVPAAAADNNNPNSNNPTSSTTTTSSSSSYIEPTTTSSSSRPTAIPPQIVKRVSVDQYSEHIDPSADTWEDSASHHTASEEGSADSGSFDVNGRWTHSKRESSGSGGSGLSAAELRKLEKKGVNPELYLEMQEAKRKGKKWAPTLLGNGFLN